MGPLLGRQDRVAKADFRAGDDAHNTTLGHHPHYHEPVLGAAGMGAC